MQSSELNRAAGHSLSGIEQSIGGCSQARRQVAGRGPAVEQQLGQQAAHLKKKVGMNMPSQQDRLPTQSVHGFWQE